MKRSSARFPKKIGVIHLPPLLGVPGAEPSGARPLEKARSWAIQEAGILVREGFDGLIVENFGDAPFFKYGNPPETIASMAVIVDTLLHEVSVPVGVNILRNDGLSALGVAAACGASYIRVNVLSGVYATDQGLIEGCAAQLLRERARLHVDVKIFADVHVKHAVPISSTHLNLAIEETALRAGADAIIVTGPSTGQPVHSQEFANALEVCKRVGVPLYVGSGVNEENVADYLKEGAGIIVGSYLRRGGVAGRPLDIKRIRRLQKATT